MCDRLLIKTLTTTAMLLLATACGQSVYTPQSDAPLARVGFVSNSEYHRVKIEHCADKACSSSSIIGFVEGQNSQFDMDKKIEKLFVRDIQAEKVVYIKISTTMTTIDRSNPEFKGSNRTAVGDGSWGIKHTRSERETLSGDVELSCSSIEAITLKANHYYSIEHQSSQTEQACSFTLEQVVN